MFGLTCAIDGWRQIVHCNGKCDQLQYSNIDGFRDKWFRYREECAMDVNGCEDGFEVKRREGALRLV